MDKNKDRTDQEPDHTPMSQCRFERLFALSVALSVAQVTWPQAPFDLDPSFRTTIQERYVASVWPFEDGSLLLSGRIRVPGGTTERGSAKILPDGSFDLSFPGFPQTTGGGDITPWQDLFYVATSQTVRRLDASGYIDQSFIAMNQGPYFLSLQGGDYHVYPDGRVLMSGAHVLSDSIRGFEGLYSLIWFSSEGYLDTTRTHRLCNGVIYAIEEQPDGKFLCTGTMTTYESQPVNTVFRVEADGALDPTFVAPLQWYGEARDYHTLPDGRILVSGPLKIIGSDEVQGIIRLRGDGSLDPTFTLLDFEATYTPSQIPSVSCIFALSPDRFIITGAFDKINGMDRGGIAMIDSSGALIEDIFDGFGCGAYDYVVSSGSTTYKSIAGIVPAPDGGFYIHGGYHGYDDGSTNDTTQRMVSRLYGLDIGVQEQEEIHRSTLHIYPNPASTFVALELDLAAEPKNAAIVIQDITGRVLKQLIVASKQQQLVLDSREFAPGTYNLVLNNQGTTLLTKNLVIRP